MSSRNVFTNYPNLRISDRYYVILQMLKTEDIFHLRHIGEKICRFVLGKFVKTCRELHNSRVRSEQEENAFLAYKTLPELDQRLYQLHSNLKSIIVFEAPTLHFPENNQILGMYKV